MYAGTTGDYHQQVEENIMNWKKDAKRVGALLLLTLFVASLVPAAFAEERSIPAIDRAGRAIRVSAQENVFFRAQTDAENSMVWYIREEVGPTTAYERCVQLVHERHPDVSQERVRMACRLRADPLRLESGAEVAAEASAGIAAAKREAAAMQRARTKVDLDEARARYLKAKEGYAESRENYREERKKFHEAREQYQRCKKGDGEKCSEHQKEMRRRAPMFLFKAGDAVLHTLSRVKANVEASEMDEERKAILLANLDARIDAIVSAQATTEGMDENTSSEDVQAAADTLRDEWKESRKSLRHAVAGVVNAKLGNIIHRAEKLSEKLDRIKARLEAQGKDTSKLDAALDEFNANIDAAVAAYAKAKVEFEAAKEGDDASVRRAQELHKEARDALHKARDALRQAVKEIRELNGSLDDDEEDGSGESGEQQDDDKSEEDEGESDEQDDASDDADDGQQGSGNDDAAADAQVDADVSAESESGVGSEGVSSQVSVSAGTGVSASI